MSAAGGGPLALFDLDGTLVDSAPDLADAVDSALVRHGIAPLGEAIVRGFIGNGAPRLIHRAITGDFDGEAEGSLFETVYASFLGAYAARLFVRTRVYPGVFGTLGELRAAGWQLGCVTNKPARFTVPLLDAADLSEYFAVVVSGDSLPTRKPDPAPLLYAANALGVSPARTVMIGDSLTDLMASRNAGMAGICVSYGYHGGVDLATLGAHLMIDDMRELPAMLGRALACPA